jgi:hypothetical protein
MADRGGAVRTEKPMRTSVTPSAVTRIVVRPRFGSCGAYKTDHGTRVTVLEW